MCTETAKLSLKTMKKPNKTKPTVQSYSSCLLRRKTFKEILFGQEEFYLFLGMSSFIKLL